MSYKTTAEVWLESYKQKDFVKMHELSQLSWKSKEQNSIKKIEDMFSGLELVSFDFLKEEKHTYCFVTLEYMVKFRFNKKLKKGIIRFNLVCEKEAYVTSFNGTWGVNPISALDLREI